MGGRGAVTGQKPTEDAEADRRDQRHSDHSAYEQPTWGTPPRNVHCTLCTQGRIDERRLRTDGTLGVGDHRVDQHAGRNVDRSDRVRRLDDLGKDGFPHRQVRTQGRIDEH